jgi:hypothetical protein
MRDYLLNTLGLKEHETIMVQGAYAIWRSIDMQSPLWKTAGADIYDRFESRIRASAREYDVASFINKLARKCHVAAPNLSKDWIIEAKKQDQEQNRASLEFAKDQSGLLVAAMRAYKDEQKQKSTKEEHRS